MFVLLCAAVLAGIDTHRACNCLIDADAGFWCEHQPTDDWQTLEAPVLGRHVQLTFPQQFSRAGEAYFNSDHTWIIFQATPRPAEGEAPGDHYEMYVAPLVRDATGLITGLGTIIQISKTGSANTCGWFHPTEPGRVLFGSTIEPPTASDRAGYQRGSGRYRWQFPEETEMVSGIVPAILNPGAPHASIHAITSPIWSRAGYDAEGSWSPDGRWILYTQVDAETGEPDLYIRDADGSNPVALVTAKGYDGGPFFSPSGTRITYRSDRKGNNLLQLFVADLAFDETGRPTGISREVQLTDNEFVNWAPYWHPSGAFLIYSTNEAAPETHNYEVFAIDARGTREDPFRIRLTHAAGFDGLPVFSHDGTMMMWTSQRGGKIEGEERPSSQIWIAQFDQPEFINLLARETLRQRDQAAEPAP